MFEWWCQLWLFETIFVEEIQQNQAILLKSYIVCHLILTYSLLNCCVNLISHLQTPVTLSPPVLKKKLPATASIYDEFLHKFDCPQNIVCYEYMNILYIKIKKQASAFKQNKNGFILSSCFITTWMQIRLIRNTIFWTNNWYKMHLYQSSAFSSKIHSDVIFFHL